MLLVGMNSSLEALTKESGSHKVSILSLTLMIRKRTSRLVLSKMEKSEAILTIPRTGRLQRCS